MALSGGHSRRHFLAAGTIGSAGLWLGSVATGGEAPAKPPTPQEQPEEDVSPAEDLMREHGVLNRMLLIYEELGRRIAGNKEFRLAALTSTATLIRKFVEDYHEKLEEDHLFPRFEKAGKLVELVKVLREQHQAGRRVTDRVVELARAETLKEADGRKRLTGLLRQFIRMYRPHEAREDTVLFPAFRDLVNEKQYDELGAMFEDQEHKLFGEHGFENIVAQVADIEKTLGINDLAQFTPKI